MFLGVILCDIHTKIYFVQNVLESRDREFFRKVWKALLKRGISG